MRDLVQDDSFLLRLGKLSSCRLEPTENRHVQTWTGFLQKYQGLSSNFVSELEKLEAVFSLEATRLYEAWCATFSEKQRKHLILSVLYYNKKKEFFREETKKILNDPSFIPPESTYKKMVLNKYSQKVITATNAKPKFKVNDLVVIADKARDVKPVLLGRMAFIVKVDSSPVTTPTKGGKKYIILPFGTAHTIETEERFLKLKRRAYE